MTQPLCQICGRPQPDTAYVCPACADKGRAQLRTIADTTSAARDVAHGQARRGTSLGGSSEGRLPFDLGATARLDAITGALATWARVVIDHRGGRVPTRTGDPLIASAEYLTGHLEWLRHQQFADEAFADISAAARVITGITDGRGERRWLGTCEAVTEAGPCPADLHARPGATYATCRDCGTRHAVAQRRDWLDETARGYSYTATEIQRAYGIRANTISVWAHRGRILATGEVDGRPVYPLGEVLDLAASEAGRRATEASRRQRRAAERGKGDDGPQPEGEAA